jgi:hypothetical protein
MAEFKPPYQAPTQSYDMLYIGSDRFPATQTDPPVNPAAGAPKDVYQVALVFAAANAMAGKHGGKIKVALLGDAVVAVAQDFLSLKPKPPHDKRPSLKEQVGALTKNNVEIWY